MEDNTSHTLVLLSYNNPAVFQLYVISAFSMEENPSSTIFYHFQWEKNPAVPNFYLFEQDKTPAVP